MAFGSQILAKLGMDTQGWDAALARSSLSLAKWRSKVNDSVAGINTKEGIKGMNEFSEKLGKIGVGFSVFRAGGQYMKAILEYAQNYTGVANENIDATKRFADSLDSLKSGFVELGAKSVGWFTKGWEGVGEEIARVIRGNAAVDLANATQKAADEAEKRLEDFKKKNDPAKLKSTREQIKAVESKTEYDSLDTHGKINAILQDNIKLINVTDGATGSVLEKEEARLQLAKNHQKIAELEKSDLAEKKRKTEELSKIEIERERMIRNAQFEQASEGEKIAILQKEELELAKELAAARGDSVAEAKALNEVTAKQIELDTRLDKLTKDKKDKEKNVAKLQKDIATSSKERSGMSIEELANVNEWQFGVGADLGSQARTARDALDLEKQAEKARLAGDTSGFESAIGKSQELRQGLNALRPSEKEDPMASLKEALDKELEELKEIREALKGKFANQ